MELRITDLLPPKNLIDVEKQYGVKGDGVTDNTAALFRMRADLAGRDRGLFKIRMPHGVVKYTDNRWLYGVERFAVESKGLTQLLVDYTGNDDVRQRPIFVGELLQNNTLTYGGEKKYEAPTRFEATLAGATRLKLIPTTNSKTGLAASDETDNTRFFPGAFLLLFYYNQVGEGYPLGARYWERVQIDKVEGGYIYLKTPLVYSYRLDVWTVDRRNEDGLDVGQPALISLDRPQNVQCKYASFKNISSLKTTGGVGGYWAITADILVLENVKNPDLPYWPQENTTRATYIDCEFNSSEHDKLTGLVENIRTTVVHDINNGGGCKRVIMDGCNTGDSLQIVTPYLTMRNGTARANVLPDPFAGAIHDYPSRAPQEEVSIENYTLTPGPDWKGDAYIRTGEFIPHPIVATSGNTIILPYRDERQADPPYFTYSCREVQSWKEGFGLFKEDGTNGGKITRIYRDPNTSGSGITTANVWVDGTWGQAPQVGELWKWSAVKTVLDNGGIKKGVVDDIPLWSKECKRWQGNRSRGDIKQTIMTFADLNTGLKSDKKTKWVNTAIDYNAFIISIDIIVTAPNAPVENNFIQVTTNADQGSKGPTPRIEHGRIALGVPGVRRVDQLGVFGQREGDTLSTPLPATFVRNIEFYHPSLTTNPANGTITINWLTF